MAISADQSIRSRKEKRRFQPYKKPSATGTASASSSDRRPPSSPYQNSFRFYTKKLPSAYDICYNYRDNTGTGNRRPVEKYIWQTERLLNKHIELFLQ